MKSAYNVASEPYAVLPVFWPWHKFDPVFFAPVTILTVHDSRWSAQFIKNTTAVDSFLKSATVATYRNCIVHVVINKMSGNKCSYIFLKDPSDQHSTFYSK